MSEAIDTKISEGERVRLDHALKRMIATIDSVRRAANIAGPIGGDTAQAVVQIAYEIATTITRHDAYVMMAKDSP